jgi:hypothetical protein
VCNREKIWKEKGLCECVNEGRGRKKRKERERERERERKRKKRDKVRDTWRGVSGWTKMG